MKKRFYHQQIKKNFNVKKRKARYLRKSLKRATILLNKQPAGMDVE